MYRSPLGRTFDSKTDALRDALFTAPDLAVKLCKDATELFRWATITDADCMRYRVIDAIVGEVLDDCGYKKV